MSFDLAARPLRLGFARRHVTAGRLRESVVLPCGHAPGLSAANLTNEAGMSMKRKHFIFSIGSKAGMCMKTIAVRR